jgi:hypothetical protein
MNGALYSIMQAYQQRLNGVDKPQFYNAWQPNADPGMQFTPDQSHPAMNDKMIMRPEDVPQPMHRQEMSSLYRLMNGFG